MKTCEPCNGQGEILEAGTTRTLSGRIITSDDPQHVVSRPCDHCGGTGESYEGWPSDPGAFAGDCDMCGGSGRAR